MINDIILYLVAGVCLIMCVIILFIGTPYIIYLLFCEDKVGIGILLLIVKLSVLAILFISVLQYFRL